MAREDTTHPTAAKAGGAAGALTGAAIGAAAGPIGIAIGAVVGGMAGARGGEALAEQVNPTDFDAHWHGRYTETDYYDERYGWGDYGPAYGLGYHVRSRYDQPFNALESDLERRWEDVRHSSRLGWREARPAILDGWQYVDREVLR